VAESADDIEAVRAANASFYTAFEACDAEAMASIWEHSDRASCTHPGAPTIHGWPDVDAAWRLILGAAGVTQFIITEERIEVVGDVGWVVAVENMIVNGASGAGSVVNWFVRAGQQWRVVGHHGAPISRPPIG